MRLVRIKNTNPKQLLFLGLLSLLFLAVIASSHCRYWFSSLVVSSAGEPWSRHLVLTPYLYMIISWYPRSYFPTSFPCCSVFISRGGQAISLPAERQLPLNPHPPYQQLHLFPSLHTVQTTSSQAPYPTRKSPPQQISRSKKQLVECFQEATRQ